MENIILFDPSIRSMNLGDHIIMDSIKYEMSYILENDFVIHSATHEPASFFYQNCEKASSYRLYKDAKYKFICGSNLLWKNLLRVEPSLNINVFSKKAYSNSILIGVGTSSRNQKSNYYTRSIYKKILSNDYIHSVRDDKTLQIVNDLGFKAINTGCPTMWRFTDEFCSEINTKKTNKVVFTLTYFNKCKVKDLIMIKCLLDAYEEVYFWPQGAYDVEYLHELIEDSKIKIISPTLNAYEGFLCSNDVDYVGTRLHGGIYAMQHKKRTIIVEIDNRTKDIKGSYNLNTIERDNIDKLNDLIYSEIQTRVGIDTEKITLWKNQFS